MSDPESPLRGLPVGVEKVLLLAAKDPEFREQLQTRRSAAALDAGFSLGASERAVLDALDPSQLGAILSALQTVAARPPETPGALAMTAGIRPEQWGAIRGIRPDSPGIVKGIRPGLPLAFATAAVVGGAIYVATLTAGVRPDLPPARTEGQADAGPEKPSQPPPK